MAALRKAVVSLLLFTCTVSSASGLLWSVDRATGAYAVFLSGNGSSDSGNGGAVAVASAATTLCHEGVTYSTANGTLAVQEAVNASGADMLGAWSGTAVTFAAAGAGAAGVAVRATFKAYAARPDALSLSAAFLGGVNSTNCVM